MKKKKYERKQEKSVKADSALISETQISPTFSNVL